MNRTQQSTAIAICLLGLAVLTAGAVFLVREWREEVAARERLQEENARLRQALGLREADLMRIRGLQLLEAQRQLQPPPNNDGS